jgi:hypothetical protein
MQEDRRDNRADQQEYGCDVISLLIHDSSMVLLITAEIERGLISQRTKEALARRKAEGKQLGRPKGSYAASKQGADPIFH